jgi:hypothetical protein
MSKVQVVSELWQFMRENKKYWLAPIVITLVLGRCLIGSGQELGYCAVHLHAVLG